MNLESIGASKHTSPILLNYKQVADLLNISETSVRRLVSLGKLPSVAVTPSGRKRMILREELDRYIDRHNRLETPPQPPMSESRRAILMRAGWSGNDHS